LSPFGWSAFTSGTVGVALLFAMTNFFGFEATAIFREEVRDPHVTIPRATYICVAAIGIFYGISAWALIMAFGTDEVVDAATKDPAGIFNVAMTEFVGRWVTGVVTVLVVTSAFAVAAVLPERPRALPVLLEHRRRASGSARPGPSAPPRAVGRAVGSRSCDWPTSLFGLLGSDPALLYARASGTGGFAAPACSSVETRA
jgi:amino acid permease-like protein